MGLRLLFFGRDALPAREIFAWVDVRRRQSPPSTPLRARWEHVDRALREVDAVDISLQKMESLLAEAEAAHPTPRKTGTHVPGICVKCGCSYPPESFLRRATSREREQYGWRGVGVVRRVKGVVCAKCRHNKTREGNRRRRTKLEQPTRLQIQRQIRQTKKNIKSAEGLFLEFFRVRLFCLERALLRVDETAGAVEEWTHLLTEQERKELVAAYQVLPRRHGRMPAL